MNRRQVMHRQTEPAHARLPERLRHRIRPACLDSVREAGDAAIGRGAY